MADPTIYAPGYDFTATDKGANLNTELNNIAASVQSVAEALADIRRSDGNLENQIVKLEALDPLSVAALSDAVSADLAAQLEASLVTANASAAVAVASAAAAGTAETNAETAASDATAAAVSASGYETAAAASAAVAAAMLASSRVAFSARKAGDQSGILSDTTTKITFATEILDFGGFYDPATSRFTPPAGRYRLSVGVAWSVGLVDARQVTAEVWKTGVAFRVFGTQVSGTTDSALVSGSCLVEADGTDYFEVFGTGFGAGDKTVSGTESLTFFEGEAI